LNQPKEVSGQRITALQANTHGKSGQNSHILRFIEEKKPDLISLQELNHIEFVKKWASERGYYSMFQEKYRLGILSKFPLLNPKVSVNMALLGAEVQVSANSKLHFAASHFDRPWPFAHVTQAKQDATKLFENLEQWWSNAEGKRVLTGDFNSAPWANNLRNTTQKLQLAEVRRPGFGWGTYPSAIPRTDISWPLPFLHLDHFYLGSGLKATDWNLLENFESDHLKVLVTFEFQ
jgi:endonuclease/exonuclease/phosphatase (EEP) superfamily protein YafD